MASSVVVSSMPPFSRRIMSADSVGSESMRDGGMPSVTARLGFESPSIARTLRPERASTRAIVPEIEVFPEPPFPATASFMAPGLYVRESSGASDQVCARARPRVGWALVIGEDLQVGERLAQLAGLDAEA